jgi:chromosome segregation ATPase
MNFRQLRILALLILAFPLSSYAQSLGDVARQLRSERQQSGSRHAKVITNDDIESRKPAGKHAAKDATQNATQDEPGKETAQASNSAEGKQETDSAADAKNAKSSAKADPAKEREARELELDKRSEEINKVYRERIATIRSQIATAQQELAKLQREQVESSNEFQRSYGTAPNIGTYEAQQRLFNEQIEAHRNLIGSLNSQLEDAQESARHAGVPHASD